MTYTNALNKIRRSTRLKEGQGVIPLLVHGQGILIFEHGDNTEPCCFRIYTKCEKQGIHVEISPNEIRVYRIPNNEPLIDKKNTAGLLNKKGVYYWLSLDSQNQRIHLGIGEARVENVLYDFHFSFPGKEELEGNKAFLETLHAIHISNDSKSLKPIRLLRDPITAAIPLLVKNTDDLTMDDIASGTYMPKSNLSLVAQKLYDCISGKNFILDNDSFPDFSKAIEHSIATPGCWCNKRLLEKANEFSKGPPNIKETYLRITLGQNNGESPGIPYVMEIWPVGHYSPIHNHSEANAVIRVLHGSINVTLFPFLCEDGIEPFGNVDFHQGDITWISATLNQTHQLKNLDKNTDTCITIQCYMYDGEDAGHYDYFDYIEDGKKGVYEPDSDMGFIEFKKRMRDEWEGRGAHS